MVSLGNTLTLLGQKSGVPNGYKFSSPGANGSLPVTPNKNSPLKKKKKKPKAFIVISYIHSFIVIFYNSATHPLEHMHMKYHSKLRRE